MIVGICAADLGGAIGYKNGLPWPRLRGDLRRFRTLTMGEAVFMGRKTWESLGKKPLKGRMNIVVTSDPERQKAVSGGGDGDGVMFVTMADVNTYVDLFVREQRNVYVIGGARLWKAFEDVFDVFYVTRVMGAYVGDVHINLKQLRRVLPCTLYTSAVVSEYEGEVQYYYEAWSRFGGAV